jgi:hypothetical protein
MMSTEVSTLDVEELKELIKEIGEDKIEGLKNYSDKSVFLLFSA